MTARAALLLLTALALPGCTDAIERVPPIAVSRSQSPAVSPSPSPAPIVFSVDEALRHVAYLVNEIGPRYSGEGELRAAEYVANEFAEIGYTVEKQQFPRASGGTSLNIIAKHPETDFSEGWVVVGGHYDTVARSPGANDNASGIGVTLALAKAFRERPIPVQWVAFGREEVDSISKKHHEGSMAYAEALGDIKKVTAAVSIDMVGSGDRLVIVRDREAPGSLHSELLNLANEMGVPVADKALGDISDHTTFTRRGVEGVLLWSGEHPTLHKPTDTYEVVQPDSIHRTGSVMTEWLKRRFSV